MHDLLGRFAPIGLEEVGDSALMDRVDRKFLVPREVLDAVLERCAEAYRVLEVSGVRASRYATRYFDTPDLALYHAHHSGRPVRSKVRVREYVETGGRFVELKRRVWGGRVRKSRIAVNGDTGAAFRALAALPEYTDSRIAEPMQLGAVVDVRYTRITLVRRDGAERVTLDLDVTMSDTAREVRFPTIVFAELKQQERGASPFADAMRALHVREGAVSKYCIGVVTLVDGARKNRFKPILSRLPHETAALQPLSDCA